MPSTEQSAVETIAGLMALSARTAQKGKGLQALDHPQGLPAAPGNPVHRDTDFLAEYFGLSAVLAGIALLVVSIPKSG